MEAICRADYEQRVKAFYIAKEAEELRKALLKKREEEKRRRKKYKKSRTRHIQAEEQLNAEDGDMEQEIVVPKVGFHDAYGIWFYGALKAPIITIGHERFGEDLSLKMHVFTDIEPVKIDDGIHAISVYDYECLLYKWTAQGYLRGLVVLRDDIRGNKAAEIYFESRTWSWMLKTDELARLNALDGV